MSSRKFPVTKAIKARRRSQAEERQAAYDLLTTQQKIDTLPPEPFAKKQRTKLLLRLAQESKPKTSEQAIERDNENSKEHLKAKDRRAKERKGE